MLSFMLCHVMSLLFSCFSSQRILGKLFRKCQSLDRAQRFSVDASQSKITPDKDMIVSGYEEYLEEARSCRNIYNTKLEGLMSLYGLKNEGEVITGCLVKVNTRLSAKTDEKFEVAQMILASLATLRANTRRDFYDEFGGEEAVMEEFEDNGNFSNDVMKKASAWYMVTYEAEDEEEATNTDVKASTSDIRGNHQTSEQRNKVTLISFPWIVDRILAKIKDTKQKERKDKGIQQQHTLNAVSDLVKDQAAYFFDGLKSNVSDDRDMRIEEKDKLQRMLNQALGGGPVPRISLCGESLTSISSGEDRQDQQHIEIYLHGRGWNATREEQFNYLRSVERALKRHGDAHLQQRYPHMLRFQRSQGKNVF